MLIGIVGKPSVGKSTFFKAATLAEVDIANYPFTTIKPNSAVGYVKIKDAAKEFGKTANPREGFIAKDYRFVPVQLLDVAGLVPGAHEGKGMGNQFLDDLRQADVLVHVIDVSGSVNEKGESVDTGSYDPANDIKFLEDELDFWINSIIKKGWDKFARTIQQVKGEVYKEIAKHLSGLGVTEPIVETVLAELNLKDKPLIDWSDEDIFNTSKQIRIKTKPMIIACNKIDMPGAEENYKRLQEQFPDHLLVKCSAESELALREAAKHELIDYIPGENTFTLTDESKLSDKQKTALSFIKDTILGKFESTGIQDVLDQAVFDKLQYIALHPGGVGKLEDSDGNVIPDCFLMKKGTTALDFAYRLHTDFGKKFIRAIDVRSKLSVGKDHELNHLDIVEIVADR